MTTFTPIFASRRACFACRSPTTATIRSRPRSSDADISANLGATPMAAIIAGERRVSRAARSSSSARSASSCSVPPEIHSFRASIHATTSSMVAPGFGRFASRSAGIGTISNGTSGFPSAMGLPSATEVPPELPGRVGPKLERIGPAEPSDVRLDDGQPHAGLLVELARFLDCRQLEPSPTI